ncbi:hypothetical protein CKA32_006820 [Geitlerinema sp. FC II]|nr:hypothetical protein CKA32_006820 [Geitlerinema sp. FC II]
MLFGLKCPKKSLKMELLLRFSLTRFFGRDATSVSFAG